MTFIKNIVSPAPSNTAGMVMGFITRRTVYDRNETIRRRNIRIRAVEKLGGKCMTCGVEGHWGIYNFVAEDPNIKFDYDTTIFHLDEKVRSTYIKLCRLLCANCDRTEYWTRHTAMGYKKKLATSDFSL